MLIGASAPSTAVEHSRSWNASSGATRSSTDEARSKESQQFAAAGLAVFKARAAYEAF